VRIEAEGPFGPIDAIDFVIILNDLKASQATAAGNLYAVIRQLRELTKATHRLNESVKKLQPDPLSISMEPLSETEDGRS
jgi:deoxyxylulose-5-phosphate synthase